MGNTPFWLDKKTGRFFYDRQELPFDTRDLEYWDSILEYRVYQKLLDFLEPGQISRQVGIQILPEKKPFKKWIWNVDFVLNYHNIVIPLEVKGKWLLDDGMHRKTFCQTLRVLQHENESLFNKLLIVSDADWQIPSTDLMVFSLHKLLQKLTTITEG